MRLLTDISWRDLRAHNYLNEPKSRQVSEAPVITVTRKIAVPAIKRTANANLKKADEVETTSTP
ncbi:hypothetical protein BGT96224_10156 [Blumeria graminis f. sp. tritici 96224]|uniref:EKA-like protein n=1 Tax=Blumeria graminis f. sp. tritici 96224 TaxID=1268274 RepID=A0A656KKG7_BLUGR|nr:hypothetical protein BGT96224_10156 [Blumeria graminis f. sp. tritici 96224]